MQKWSPMPVITKKQQIPSDAMRQNEDKTSPIQALLNQQQLQGENATVLKMPILEGVNQAFHQFEKALGAMVLTTSLVEEFNLRHWQQKLKQHLSRGHLENALKQLPNDSRFPLFLCILEDENDLPLAIGIKYAYFELHFDLNTIATEVNRIKQFNLSYVYEMAAVENEVEELTSSIERASSNKEIIELIIAFNQKWQDELSYEYRVQLPRPNSRRQKAKATYTVTDVSGLTVWEGRRYPVNVFTDVYQVEPPVKISACRDSFFKACTAVTIAATVATGLYLKMQ